MFFDQLLRDIKAIEPVKDKLKFIKEVIVNYENLATVLRREPSTSISLSVIGEELGQLRKMRDRLELNL